MDFEVLNRTKTKFREIANFYIDWNTEPEFIISYLLEQPYTKQRMEANRIQRERYQLSGLQSSNKMPPPYKLSYKDVDRWLYFDRIVPLRDDEFLPFFDELQAINNETEERSRADWCKDFQNILNFLSDQLTILDSMPLSVSSEITDWVNIDKDLRMLNDTHVRQLISQYKTIIEKYYPAINSQKTVEVYILPNAREALIADLIQYVDKEQHKSLVALINDQVFPNSPIVCRCEQVRLAEIFYERVKAGPVKARSIQGDKTKIVKWICRHFRRIQSGRVEELKESVISRYLKGLGFSKKK